MKSYSLILLVSLITICFFTTPALTAYESAPLEVIDATICRDVVRRIPIDPDNSYSVAIGKVYCFSKIGGAQSPTEITHVWYFGDVERAQVRLPVRSEQWRTWSSKTIQLHEVGQWFVDVVGPDGKVLKTLQFKIKP